MVDIKDYVSKASQPKKQPNSLAAILDKGLSYLRNINQKPIALQFGLGSSGGLVTGFIFGKTSRLMAICLGLSIVLLQFCNFRGYLRFNQTSLERDLRDVKNSLTKELGIDRPLIPTDNEVESFLTKNLYLFSGFGAGSLIGYGLG
uniref:FUN14 domain-containing protein 1 n=1 Tax=Rhabditophanes sp. KR3021 TaxID=114890 RepID=A0AC35TLI5_9BILA